MNVCENCTFVLKELTPDLSASYVCRRYPPQVVVMITQQGPQIVSIFTATQAQFTCGEFSEKHVPIVLSS